MNADLFSPLDTRYRKDLPESLSEAASLHWQVEVEKAWLLALMDEGLCPKVPEKKLDEALDGLGQNEIDEIEARTRHATRALVEAIAARLEKAGLGKAAAKVHVGITSFDTVDTAQRLRARAFFAADFLPELAEFLGLLRKWSKDHMETLQVGRTHGQWAVPTYFGLQFAEAHERISELLRRLEFSLEDLRGQSSGAVGGYQATSLMTKNPLELEDAFLKRLELKPHYGSTQILPPEDLTSLAQDMVSICSVVAKLATDYRHLARSEIGEIAEGFAEGQVGSSTMPQKRNPWNLEHVCSLYKVLLSKLQLLQLDMVSEHQRDLTNSASGRFHFEVFAVGFLMVRRMNKILSRMEAIPKNMQKHLASAGSSVFAEALYVLAAMDGHEDAHHIVRECARESERSGKTLLEVAADKKVVKGKLELEDLRRRILEGSRLKFERIAKGWKEKGNVRTRRG